MLPPISTHSQSSRRAGAGLSRRLLHPRAIIELLPVDLQFQKVRVKSPVLAAVDTLVAEFRSFDPFHSNNER